MTRVLTAVRQEVNNVESLVAINRALYVFTEI